MRLQDKAIGDIADGDGCRICPADRQQRLMLLRRQGGALPQPFAVVADRGGAQVLASLNAEAEAAGLSPGQPLRDATAMCPALITRTADPLAEAAFLTVLRRWAGKFSPWVAEEPPASLVIDLTGCAHLFGGEAALLAEVEADCAGLGLTVRAGVADTPGAAWAAWSNPPTCSILAMRAPVPGC